jgi:hypothetical protein
MKIKVLIPDIIIHPKIIREKKYTLERRFFEPPPDSSWFKYGENHRKVRKDWGVYVWERDFEFSEYFLEVETVQELFEILNSYTNIPGIAIYKDNGEWVINYIPNC